MSHVIKVDGFRTMDIGEVIESIDLAPKKSLEQLRLFDLLLTDGSNQALRHGVYIFFNQEGECVYVGMCSSSHFAHRIGGHFGMSPKYGMNTFLRRVVNGLNLKPSADNGYDHYVTALSQIGQYSILLIDANGKGRKFVRALERLLHAMLKPNLNFPKGMPKTYKSFTAEVGFDDAIAQCGGS
ncbi:MULTISPECIES: GIY-YIG nuclease family protein [Halomonadaceae]|uniref:GIY-YIG nuclease family protein n=1 Tax=Halomonadaceae TaxID=28256 RepID=UPI0012F21986|nr:MULTISPECIES: GIY-YIG nuclease family protein [Halomonas]CAD5255619.1 conserved hypothetical protein [Halomonas sp. 156]CAD5293464.1 conserved hypothetical protein [Halomonas sp. 113]QNU61179.1 GIY-YIG nuclease family protein [Halomonas titanicae]CAD5294739.1 conserved hypothetical protein [Halomonas sp. 59]VXC64215.1 conserved hypothetical protein [Halomonas titanicae]